LIRLPSRISDKPSSGGRQRALFAASDAIHNLHQILLNGLVSGLVIALLGLAFTIASLPTRVFHVALAGIYTAVPFIVWSMWKTTWNPVWGVVVAVTSGVVLSVLCEALNHWWLERKGAPDGLHLVASLGISIMLVQIGAMVWGNDTQVLREGIDLVFQWGSFRLTRSQLIAGSVSAGLLALFAAWLRLSKQGLQFRALADNPTQLALFGYNIRALRLVAFALSGLLASVASLLTAYDIGFSAHDGLHALLLGIVAVIVGGRGTWFGPLVAGVLLGLIRAFVIWQFSARWQDAATFAVLVAFLFLRPQGLLGRKTRLETSF
jgi:branched-chain amino acid transport system permease protein